MAVGFSTPRRDTSAFALSRLTAPLPARVGLMPLVSNSLPVWQSAVFYLDHHEGLGTWLSAGATFVTAITALCIAWGGSRIERNRRSEETLRQSNAVAVSLENAFQIICEVRDIVTKAQSESANLTGLRISIRSANLSVQFALRQPASELDLLLVALNIEKMIVILLGEIDQVSANATFVSNSDVCSWFLPFEEEIVNHRARLLAIMGTGKKTSPYERPLFSFMTRALGADRL
jgi:hypothetical protein